MASMNTQIGQTVVLKGEISARESLLIDGEVEGTVELQEASLTVGPHGRVTADIRAKEIIIDGAVKGNLYASERIEIRRSGSVVGDLVSARVMIEDGAYFKGSVDIVRLEAEAPRPPAEPVRVGLNVPVEAKDFSRSVE
jgi:cytoskeletal protein CcmA (bactofilin family)